MSKKKGKNAKNSRGSGKQGTVSSRADNVQAAEMDGCRTKKGKNICDL